MMACGAHDSNSNNGNVLFYFISFSQINQKWQTKGDKQQQQQKYTIQTCICRVFVFYIAQTG